MRAKETSELGEGGPKRLYRSETNRIIAGVCGGLGEYFDLDPTLIRLFFVLLTVFGGSGILLYIILWLVIPPESAVLSSSEDRVKRNVEEMKGRAEGFARDIRNVAAKDESRMWWGVLILLAGFVILFSNFGLISAFHLGRLWPLILIALGFALLIRR
jgi:phage shock protein PspC (stress-responsive transcriptional regulator)